jgi:hypothetical protein
MQTRNHFGGTDTLQQTWQVDNLRLRVEPTPADIQFTFIPPDRSTDSARLALEQQCGSSYV